MCGLINKVGVQLFVLSYKRIKILQTLTANHSYFHNVGTEPLKSTTVGLLLEAAAKNYTATVAMVSRNQKIRITYGELLEQADKLAAGFRLIGLEKGDRVGIWCPNMVEWTVTKLAIARAGLIMVPTNSVYVANEIKYCINKVGMKAIVCPDVIKNVKYYDTLNEICPSIRTSEPGKLNCKEIPSLRSIVTISNETLGGTYNYYELLDKADLEAVKSIQSFQKMVQPDDVCCIHFTSGTTGLSNAAVLTHFNITNSSYFTAKHLQLQTAPHIGCVQVPFAHVFGDVLLLTGQLHFECTLVIPAPFYNPEENLIAISEEGCTSCFGTPTMYVDLVSAQKEHKFDLNLRYIVTGASPCSPTARQQIKDVLNVKQIMSAYGATEATSGVFTSLPDEDDQKALTTVGRLCEHWEAKVVDENNRIVPFGTPGQLCVRSYGNMLGYWDDERKTRETIGTDGWLKTGDLFVLYEDGYGRILGRLKDLINRGGENISALEIEDVINKHPAIKESCVIGLPSERLGEEVCACVRLIEPFTITLDELREFCKGKLAKHKIPTILKVVDNFPKTQSGKPQKYLLKQQFSKV